MLNSCAKLEDNVGLCDRFAKPKHNKRLQSADKRGYNSITTWVIVTSEYIFR